MCFVYFNQECPIRMRDPGCEAHFPFPVVSSPLCLPLSLYVLHQPANYSIVHDCFMHAECLTAGLQAANAQVRPPLIRSEQATTS